MKTLFDRTSIGPFRLRNRLVQSATWEAMPLVDGRPTPRRVHDALARGGAGLIFTGATTFAPDAPPFTRTALYLCRSSRAGAGRCRSSSASRCRYF